MNSLFLMAAAPGLTAIMSELALKTWDFCIVPSQWSNYQKKHIWKEEDLVSGNIGRIPKTEGIYSLILKPNIADHPTCYLFYIGQTDSLQRRFTEYLGKEKKENGRPLIFRFLNVYDGYVKFFYTTHPEKDIVTDEKALINSFLPPLNKDDIEGNIGRARRAFR